MGSSPNMDEEKEQSSRKTHSMAQMALKLKKQLGNKILENVLKYFMIVNFLIDWIRTHTFYAFKWCSRYEK